MLPKHHIYFETIINQLLNGRDVVAISRYNSKNVTFFGIFVCVARHRGDDACVNFLLFVCCISIICNHLEPGTPRKIPDLVILRRSGAKKHRPRDFFSVGTCHKFKQFAKAHSVISINNISCHGIVDAERDSFTNCTYSLAFNKNI